MIRRFLAALLQRQPQPPLPALIAVITCPRCQAKIKIDVSLLANLPHEERRLELLDITEEVLHWHQPNCKQRGGLAL